MKKTQTINLGGIIFHIELDAFDQFSAYLDSVKKQFSDTDGQDEIIADIEARIAEILNEKKIKIITHKNVDDVIIIMGKPEQYGDDESETQSETPPPKAATKRIYRHPDDKVLGGICGGLGALVGVDPVIFRILFLVTAFFGGFGALIYLVMWAIVPMAQSTSDRLKMAGKPVTADTIGKAVADQTEKSSHPKKNGNILKKLFSAMGTIFEAFLSLFKKLFKALSFILRPLFGILFLIIGLGLTLWGAFIVFGIEGMLSFIDTSFSYIIGAALGTLPISEYFIYGALLLFFIIPIFQLIYFGLRLLFHLGSQPGFLKGLLTSVWIVSFISLIIFGVYTATRFSAEGISRRDVPLSRITAASVKVSIWENDFFLWDDRHSHTVKRDGDDILVADVDLDIKLSDDDRFHLVVHKEANASTSGRARDAADEITYKFLPSSDELLLNNYLKLDDDSPYGFQEVDLTLLVPKGRSVYLDESLKYILDDVQNVRNMWDRHMAGHTWEMKDGGLTCIDCD